MEEGNFPIGNLYVNSFDVIGFGCRLFFRFARNSETLGSTGQSLTLFWDPFGPIAPMTVPCLPAEQSNAVAKSTAATKYLMMA